MPVNSARSRMYRAYLSIGSIWPDSFISAHAIQIEIICFVCVTVVCGVSESLCHALGVNTHFLIIKVISVLNVTKRLYA